MERGREEEGGKEEGKEGRPIKIELRGNKL
jgi:hypothetical protein